jgi:hypothetical protein
LGSIHADGDKITIGAGRSETDYAFDDLITIGLDTLAKATAETSTAIAATSFVWYKITKAGTVITAVIEHGAARPTQAHGELYIVLGEARWDGSKIDRWSQFHFGDISMHARFA